MFCVFLASCCLGAGAEQPAAIRHKTKHRHSQPALLATSLALYDWRVLDAWECTLLLYPAPTKTALWRRTWQWQASQAQRCSPVYKKRVSGTM